MSKKVVPLSKINKLAQPVAHKTTPKYPGPPKVTYKSYKSFSGSPHLTELAQPPKHKVTPKYKTPRPAQYKSRSLARPLNFPTSVRIERLSKPLDKKVHKKCRPEQPTFIPVISRIPPAAEMSVMFHSLSMRVEHLSKPVVRKIHSRCRPEPFKKIKATPSKLSKASKLSAKSSKTSKMSKQSKKGGGGGGRARKKKGKKKISARLNDLSKPYPK